MSRYAKLFELVCERKPKHVVEIGTWNGKRAVEFMGAINCYYTGFDLFEDADKDSDERELNVKRHFEVTEVGKYIERAGFTRFQLIRGDTRKTLKEWVNKIPAFDFAFIDGGHSIETIESDFNHIRENIEPGGLIVLDDYYDPELVGFGCNQVIKDIEHEVLRFSDRGPNTSISLVTVNA